MHRLINSWLIRAVIGFMVLGPTSQTLAKSKLEKLSEEVLETLQSFYPVRSTRMGIHAYDNRLTDYSSGSVRNAIKEFNSYEKRLYRFKGAKLSASEEISFQLLKSNVDIALLDLKRIAWHKRAPQLYIDDVVDGIYHLMLAQSSPLAERIVPIISRMRAVPQHLQTARNNLRKPPALLVELALGNLEKGIDFYRAVAGELMNKFPERADVILKVSTAAREAMTEYGEYLEQLKPGDQKRMAIGKDSFDYLLAHKYYLSFDSDSLLILGETMLAQARATYTDYEKVVESDHQNGTESVFVPAKFDRQDIFDYYHWEANESKNFLKSKEIVTVRDNFCPISIVEPPDYLRDIVDGVTYQQPGPYAQSDSAILFVRPIPTDLDSHQLAARYRYVHRRGFRASIVHEVFPGHHYQQSMASDLSDPIRKWQTNPMLVEGWTLYCDEMLYTEKFYGEADPVQWLTILSEIRYRSALVIADVKLHTGQFTVDACLEWLAGVLSVETSSGREFLIEEVGKIIQRPARPMADLLGKREIARLREAYRQKHGDGFSLSDFHDALLANGSIPPTLLWREMGLEKYRAEL